MLNIAVFVSGGGTNLQALIDAQDRGEIKNGKITFVLASNENAYALERAKKAGIPSVVVNRKSYSTKDEYDKAVLQALDGKNIDLIVLAGFLSILGEELVNTYKNRIINIHPSLIPLFCGDGFYGKKVHTAVLNSGMKVTGATAHFVNEITDGGAIILQKAVPIEPGDNEDILQYRVMRQAEWEILPKAVSLFCQGRIKINGNKTERIYHILYIMYKRCTMEIKSLASELNTNSYPGRGIVVGKSADGKKAVIAYFIMGRSFNSRNRIFEPNDRGGIRTKAFDESKMEDPSLIIYNPVLKLDGKTIVTNGDQTDTIYDFMQEGKCYRHALNTREFEPDAPNYTQRISAVLKPNGDYNMSILKSNMGKPQCLRFYFEYPADAGLGHFIHTYKCDGNPIPSYEGEPTPVAVGNDDIDTWTDMIWDNLNEDNKVSLFTRYIDLQTGEEETRIVNKNK